MQSHTLMYFRLFLNGLINLSIDFKLQRQVMNRICSKQPVKTPFFQNKHSKSTSCFQQESVILDFTDDARKKEKEHMKYRNIHKKFSENRINTLDDILAKTLNGTQEGKSHQKIPKPFRKVPTASALHTKILSNQLKSHSKSIRSFKSSLHTFSSQQKHQQGLAKNKRSINKDQAQRVARILNNICNKSIRDKFQQKSRHSITDWIRLVHQIEESSKNQLHFMPMVNQSKLVLWTESKIVKTVENIYEGITKNGQKSCTDERNEDLFDNFQEITVIIKGYFLKKYKTQKLMKETLTNLIYSLHHHIQKMDKNCSSIAQLSRLHYLSLFQDILGSKYETQDILFCLFSRKIIQELYQEGQGGLISLNEKRSKQFFMVMSENDQQLIQQYELNMKEYFRAKKDIDLYQFLSLITTSYKQKRLKRKAKASETKHVKHQNKYHQRVSNQLSSINYEYDQHFWILQSQTGPGQHTQLKNQIEYQAKRLINMLCNALPIEYKTFIKELVVVKGMQIVQVCQKYNKKSILQELGLYQTLIGQQFKPIYLKNLEQLRNEALLVFNCLKNKSNDPKILQKFVKKLLTTPLLSNKLYEIIEYFEILMHKRQIHQ